MELRGDLSVLVLFFITVPCHRQQQTNSNLNSCRLLKKVRAKVCNKAHVEASIVEGCLVEEISYFTSLYLPQLIPSSRNRPQCYAQSGPPSDCTLSLFQVRGWKSGRGVTRFLTFEEYKIAMIYIFTNMTEMEEFIQ